MIEFSRIEYGDYIGLEGHFRRLLASSRTDSVVLFTTVRFACILVYLLCCYCHNSNCTETLKLVIAKCLYVVTDLLLSVC